MARKAYKAPQPQETQFFGSERRLPTDRYIASYYRQSTLKQVGNISTQIQTIDLPASLERMGWARDRIILIDMDAGLSGTKKIDERPGMKLLFEMICRDEIGAVACEDEDRLFRDVTQIQVNIFIEACRAHGALVITPSMIYDFANPQMGDFHARQFRFKSEMAAEYIKTFVKGKLHKAAKRMKLEGLWVGTSLPPGFMIDVRKTLSDGSFNPNWRRLSIFEPIAKVVQAYYDIFIGTGGCVNKTMRLIEQSGPYYPDPTTWQLPPGFRIPEREWRQWGNGRFPATVGLEGILTNVAYIGHWTVENVIVRYNNHPAIIEFETFMKAFNFLSAVTFEGSPNPNYRPYRQHVRPKPEAERNVDPPLLRGLLVSYIDGDIRNVGCNWIGAKNHYVYKVHETTAIRTFEWTRIASQIDDNVVSLLLDKLRATFSPEVWDSLLDQFDKRFEVERHRISQQITALEKVKKNLVTSLQSLDDPELIKAVQERYREAKAEEKRLNAALARENDERAKFDAILALKDNCGPALDNWPNLTYGGKVNIIRAFIRQIEATVIDDNGLELDIMWRDDSHDKTLVVRQTKGTDSWLKSDVMLLLNLIDGGASQIEIAAAFPARRWEHIRRRYSEERPNARLYFDPQPIQYLESYQVYLKRMGQEKKKAQPGDRWTTVDEKLLLELLDEGATQVELSYAFPMRKWWRIRHHITAIRGKGIVIPEVGIVLRDETFADFLTRLGMSEEEYTATVRGTTSFSLDPAGSHARAPSQYIDAPYRLPRSGRADGVPARRWPAR